MPRSELIFEDRRRKDAGESRRKIVARVAEDLHYDRSQLACDHHLLLMAAMVKAGEGALSCRECLEEWLKRPARGRKRHDPYGSHPSRPQEAEGGRVRL
jgi:hypothetical protein